MKTLLVIDSSARVTRSITRQLSQRLAERWQAHHPDGRVVHRDVGREPPPMVDEAWIAGAFAPPEQQTEAGRAALRVSDGLIDELQRADAVVFAVPMYNFGLPAALKAYIDQVVRVGRTFAFLPEEAEPYRPLLADKPVAVITAAGDGAVHPGGALYHLNHCEPHLKTVLGFIGLNDVTFVRVGYDEFQDERLRRSLAAAEVAVEHWADALAPAVQLKAS